MPSPTGATWLASYPKSGNTWLRLLLESYRTDSVVDINDNRISTSDAGRQIIQAVSPLSLEELGDVGEFLVRPAGLVNFFAMQRGNYMVKTHFANLYSRDLPPFIPAALTRRAIYIVRDPRSVAVSFSRYFGHSMPMTCDIMNSPEFKGGGVGDHATSYISSWSGHVSSWIAEKQFPVHVVKYEDLLLSPEGELSAIVEFLEWDLDVDRIARAVENSDISRCMKREQEKGFRENGSNEPGAQFFNGGGSRWEDELAPKWARRIEKDHQKVMSLMGYLEETEDGNITRIA